MRMTSLSHLFIAHFQGWEGKGVEARQKYTEGGVGEAGEKRAEEGSSKGREAEK